MKFMLVLFILCVTFFSCNPEKKDTNLLSIINVVGANSINKNIDLIFYLGAKHYDNYADFKKNMSKSYDLDNVIYLKPQIKIKYSYCESLGKIIYQTFLIKADNNKNFTIGELLYKINEMTYDNLKDDEHIFLEGIGYISTDKNGIDLYELYQGS